MASENQKFEWAKNIVLRVFSVRNQVQNLRDSINNYVSQSPGWTDEQKAYFLFNLDFQIGSAGRQSLCYQLDLMIDWIDNKLTTVQRQGILDLYETQTSAAARNELQAMYDGMKALRTTLGTLRQPSRSMSNTYTQLETDLLPVATEINAIPRVELGLSSVT